MRRRVYLIFGGRSGEHEVSLMSARNIMEALDKSRYEVVPIGISKAGRWILSGDPLAALTQGVEAAGGLPVALPGDPTIPSLLPTLPERSTSAPPAGDTRATDPADVPVFFPVLHGPMGEDGTIQGLLELAEVPYVGCGVLASAAGMDKAVAKALFAQAGLPVVPGLVVLRSRWEREPAAIIAEVEATLGYPCFIKPANLGSSVGVSKAKDRTSLAAALGEACRFDRKILAEQAVHAREIEVSVLGNEDPVASLPGEIIPGGEFYDYQDKYFDGKAQLCIPAELTAAQTADVQAMAVQAFRAVEGCGMARVDFFQDRGSGQFFVNEVNTIPGFTRISMYPKLWEVSGLPYGGLLNRLIDLALERFSDRQRTQKTL